VAKRPETGWWVTGLLVLSALVLFALLWLTIDSNMFSGVSGAP